MSWLYECMFCDEKLHSVEDYKKHRIIHQYSVLRCKMCNYAVEGSSKLANTIEKSTIMICSLVNSSVVIKNAEVMKTIEVICLRKGIFLRG